MGKTWCERVGDGTGEMGWYSISQLLYTSLACGSGRGIKAAQRRTLVSQTRITVPLKPHGEWMSICEPNGGTF